MYAKSIDTEIFEEIGELSPEAQKLENLCLSLGFGDVDIRVIDSRFFLVNMEGWTPYMPLGATVKESSRTLSTLAPTHILDHVDKLDDEEIEEMFDQAQIDRDRLEDDFTPEQEKQVESNLRSYMLFHRISEGTFPWKDAVH